MKKLALLSVALSALAGCFASCGDKNETPAQQAGVFKIAKTAYSVSDGSKNTASWTAGEECGLLVDGIDENIIGVAINTTESASPFTFTFPSAGRGKACCFYSPRDDNSKFSNGKLSLDLTAQTGELRQYMAAVYDGQQLGRGTSDAPKLTLKPVLAIARVHVPACSSSDPRRLASVTLSGNSGELIGGTATIGFLDDGVIETSATDTKCTVTYAEPLDLANGADVYMAIAPTTFEKGYTVTVTDEKGQQNTVAYSAPETFSLGTITPTQGKFGYTELAFVGSTNVYIINADNSTDDNLDVVWHWDSSTSDIPDAYRGMFVHCDDAKSVNDGKQILVTSSSSTGGCALIDRLSKKCLFYARCNNAHSATMLPSDRIVVACSTGNNERHNSLLVFDQAEPDKVKYQAKLKSAHGVQWIASRQRLYAIGENNLVEYSLQDWDTSSPKLKVERTIKTPTNGLHDLAVVSDDELLCAGNNAYLLRLDNMTFTELKQFHGETKVKSVNYNKSSGAIWTTIAEESWWTFHIKEMHIGSNDPVKVLSVPFSKYGTNVYKCRVYQW